MKATKKIVGAAVALVSAVALSAGTTFAWFAMNDTATATGLQVTATTPKNLAIEAGYKASVSDVTKTTIAMSGGNLTEMKPVAISTSKPETGATIADGSDSSGAVATAGALYALDATYSSDSNKPTAGTPGTATGYTAVGESEIDSTGSYFKWKSGGATTTGEVASLTGYVAGYNMTLANSGVAVDVKAEVEVTLNTTDTTYTFLRTGFLVGVPGDTSTTYTFYSIANSGSNALSQGTTTNNKFTYTDLIKSFKANSVVTITFLVWFDGNDTDCYTNNALTPGQLTVGITYTAAAAAGAGA